MTGGCDDEETSAADTRSRAAAKTMKFNVDPALIGPMRRFEQFNIQLAPPVGWEPMPDEQVAAVARAAGIGQQAQPNGTTAPSESVAAGSGALVSAEPLAVFASPDQGTWLIVSAVDVLDPMAYEAALRSAHNVLNSENFVASDIEVRQYLVRAPNLVNLKLLLAAPGRAEKRLLQLDYVFAEQQYAQSGRILESSLGSIRTIGQNGA